MPREDDGETEVLAHGVIREPALAGQEDVTAERGGRGGHFGGTAGTDADRTNGAVRAAEEEFRPGVDDPADAREECVEGLRADEAPAAADRLAVVVEGGSEARESERPGHREVVAVFPVRVERQMDAVERDAVLQRGGDGRIVRAGDALDAAAPGDAVVADRQIRALRGGGGEKARARVHAEGDLVNRPGVRDLQAVVRDVRKTRNVQRAVEPRCDRFDFHKALKIQKPPPYFNPQKSGTVTQGNLILS